MVCSKFVLRTAFYTQGGISGFAIGTFRAGARAFVGGLRPPATCPQVGRECMASFLPMNVCGSSLDASHRRHFVIRMLIRIGFVTNLPLIPK